MKKLLGVALEEDHPIGPDAAAAVAKRSDDLGGFQRPGRLIARIQEDEVVSGPGELPERPALPVHQTRPVSAHQRRRQTIQTASRMIFFDILLAPSVRSTNTIGISTTRNFFRQTLKCISIWNA